MGRQRPRKERHHTLLERAAQPGVWCRRHLQLHPLRAGSPAWAHLLHGCRHPIDSCVDRAEEPRRRPRQAPTPERWHTAHPLPSGRALCRHDPLLRTPALDHRQRLCPDPRLRHGGARGTAASHPFRAPPGRARQPRLPRQPRGEEHPERGGGALRQSGRADQQDLRPAVREIPRPHVARLAAQPQYALCAPRFLPLCGRCWPVRQTGVLLPLL